MSDEPAHLIAQGQRVMRDLQTALDAAERGDLSTASMQLRATVGAMYRLARDAALLALKSRDEQERN